MKKLVYILGIAIMFASCSAIRPGEAGIKTKFGRMVGKTKTSGAIVFNPFTSRVIKLPIRTINRELLINLPSKEGLTIQSEISILYKIKPDKVTMVVQEIGMDYDKTITAVFRSASADVCSKYFAKDMHSGMRFEIENEILKKMNGLLESKGFIIEAVLMKSITLPEGLAKAIEEKLQAEQETQRMDFVLATERKEAERKKIEAEGVSESQKILSDGLTDKILQLRYIEALNEFGKSNNSKIIISDGKTPMLMTPETK